MKKQTFYVLSITLTLIGASLCTSCHRLMGDDDDMIEVDEETYINYEKNQQDILNNAFDVKDEIIPTTNAENKNDSIDANDVTNRLVHDSIRFREN